MSIDSTRLELLLEDSAATEALGARLAGCVAGGCLIHLHGELGAGKTTLVRGFLRGRGYSGAVKSPTYTLVESYPFECDTVYHFDLYRLGDPEELEYMGIRDYLDQSAVCLVEWPQRGEGVLPQADLEVYLEYRRAGRALRVQANTPAGEALVECLQEHPVS